MKKVLLFCLFLVIGLSCFGQELVITSVENNGGINRIFDKNGNWPTASNVNDRWESLIKNFHLERLENDPFNPNQLEKRIIEMSENATRAPMGGEAFAVYFTVGNRRFICLLYYENLGASWFWPFEVKN